MLSFDLSAPWRDMPLAAVDTETTGLDPQVQRVIEVGIVRFERGQVAERWGTLLDPDMPIPRESADVHKITDEMVKGKPLFRKVKWEIWARMRDRLFVAYNADFDWRFLEAEMARAGLTMPSVPVLDPIVWARQLLAGEKSHRLERVCEKLGIPLESAHRAEHDAEAAGKVALRLADKLPVSLGDLLREQAAWKRKQDEAYAARRAEREQRAVGRGGGEGSGREPEEAADRKQTGLF